MGLVKLIELILGFLFTDDRLALRVPKALHNALVVQLVLLFLLLLLLQLQPHELDLLLAHGRILNSLALQRIVNLFQLLDNIFKLLNPLGVLLVFLLLGRVLSLQLGVEPALQFRIRAGQFFLRFFEKGEFS